MVTQKFGGWWTRRKREILRRYLDAYTTALKNTPFKLIYIDAFAGAGSWQPDSAYDQEHYGEFNELLKGSPSIAIDIADRQFDQLHFIDNDSENVASLESLKKENPDRKIIIELDDANLALPRICRSMDESERAVVFLDPFATEVAWSTIESIADTKKIDCWILFPLMAVSRMMPTGKPPNPGLSDRLDRIFGDSAHWRGMYATAKQQDFWSEGAKQEREPGSQRIAEMYAERLDSVFERVAPTQRVFKNSRNSELFRLMFAASNPRGARIAVDIANHILKNW